MFKKATKIIIQPLTKVESIAKRICELSIDDLEELNVHIQDQILIKKHIQEAIEKTKLFMKVCQEEKPLLIVVTRNGEIKSFIRENSDQWPRQPFSVQVNGNGNVSLNSQDTTDEPIVLSKEATSVNIIRGPFLNENGKEAYHAIEVVIKNRILEKCNISNIHEAVVSSWYEKFSCSESIPLLSSFCQMEFQNRSLADVIKVDKVVKQTMYNRTK